MMYRNQLVYGFHGIDKDIGLRILNQKEEFKRRYFRDITICAAVC